MNDFLASEGALRLKKIEFAFPALEQMFFVTTGAGKKPRNTKKYVDIPLLDNQKGKSTEWFVEIFKRVIMSHDKLFGLSWEKGDSTIHLKVLPVNSKREYVRHNDPEFEELLEFVLKNIFSFKGFCGFEWDFDDEFLTVYQRPTV